MSWGKIVAKRGGSMNHGIGIRHGKAAFVFFFLLVCTALALWAPNAGAQAQYYVDRGCSGCHGATPTTCNGCHEHGVRWADREPPERDSEQDNLRARRKRHRDA